MVIFLLPGQNPWHLRLAKPRQSLYFYSKIENDKKVINLLTNRNRKKGGFSPASALSWY
jgi:hypothetical protein